MEKKHLRRLAVSVRDIYPCDFSPRTHYLPLTDSLMQATYQETRIQALTTERANELREEDFPSHHPQVNLVAKSARAHSKGYHINTPLVPSIVVERILAYISKLKFGHKPDLVLSTCKYWSLKREARRGAPLLKRLHLEPWTSGKLADAEIDKEARVRSLEVCSFLP